MIDKNSPILTDLSHELICHILQYLPLQDVLSVSMLCKKLQDAVSMHLRLCKSIDFCEGKIYGYMPLSITDDHMHCLFDKCPNLETVYGLHPLKVERRRLRKRSALTVPGIIEALSLCHNLKSVETSDLRLLEAIMQHLPQIKIIGHFQNRDGVFPPQASHRLKLLHYPRISSLHLIGVEVPELTAMPHLEHLHLQCVRFTKLQPFRAFLASRLKTFVMKHCMGPTLSLRYLSLIIALSSAPSLTRLELVRVPLPGGLFQRAVEDSFRHNGFVNLKTLVISGCKGVMEADLGHLMIVASKNLERVFVQPSLTRDSLFVSLSFAQCEFPKLQDIHLGYVDKLDFTGSWSNDSLVSLGLAEVPDTPSSLTDSGMKVISELFPHIKRMSVSNCPHLMLMDQWSVTENGQIQGWRELTDLTLQRCHCLQLLTFTEFLERLPKIEVVILNDMFREPPKGCSHVGLSAGTGLGMSSAVVSNQDEHIAVQGHQQDFELQADDHIENEEIDRDFIDVIENEENPDQHIMVLQQEFFDEENHVAPAAILQRENVDPENRIDDIEQDVPENFIRRELNEDYYGYMNENNEGEDSYDPKYMLFDEFVSSSGDEDDQPKPSKMSKKVGTDSYDFQIGAANKGCCGESSKYPSIQHKSSSPLPDEKMNVDLYDKTVSNNQNQGNSCSESSKYSSIPHKSSVLPDEKMNVDSDDKKGNNNLSQDKSCSESSSAIPDRKMNVDLDDKKGFNNQSQDKSNSESSKYPSMQHKTSSALPDGKMNVNFNDKKVSNNQSQDKSCSESSKYPSIPHKLPSALPSGKINVDFDDKKGFNNQSQDKSSRTKNGNSYIKKCEHSKICTNKCSKGFDPNQPSTSRDGNCLDCSCVDSDSEMKGVEINIKMEIESDDNNQQRYPTLQPATQKRKYYDRKYLDSMPDETLFKGPLTRNRKKILHQKIKKEPAVIESPKVITVNRDESFDEPNGLDIPLENRYLRPANPPRFNNIPIKTEPVDDGYENPLNNQDAIVRPQLINPPNENINNVDGKKKIRKHKQRHKGHSSIGNTLNNQNINKKHRHKSPSNGDVSKAHDKLRAKKHKKHKHKKSKKSSKHSRPSRKKGPITRSRSFRHLYVGCDLVSQGTQATSADIRRTLRRQRTCSLRCKKKGNSICGSSHRRSHNHISARQQMKRPRQTNPNVELVNKSTSTSDPLMEDDAVQTLRLMSETLISITIISCGISDLFIDECLSLRHVEVQACRILKMLQINSCPYLERFNISQCPKLSLEVVASETLDVITQANLLVCFEPCMQVYYPSNTEKVIFSKAVQDFNVVLYQDFTSPANEVVQAIVKENLLGWTYITDKMYESPLYQSFYKHWLVNERKKRKKRVKTFFRESRLRYPYGHSLRKIHGFFPLPPSNDTDCGKEGKYQILTNDHIFTSLLENKSWDKGFPTPEACDEYVEENLLLSMMDTEYTHRKYKLRRKTTAFYIPFSNSN